MTTIKLHNTKTRKREDFVPIDPENVRMYVCGPTVYDRAHLGNARPVIVFDVLYRLLRHVYGPDHVTYVRNFTDVDDKINATALSRQEAGAEGTLEELIAERSNETINWYLEDMAAVGALEPNYMPRATAYIPQMIKMIQTLIKKGYAYSKPISFGHNSKAVYFNADKAPEHSFFKVEEYKNYGELSGRSLDEMIAGSRAEVGEGKDNPMDFVLWKPSKVDEPGWDSPWGIGRPGWHIECSAMAKALLGDTFDIHGGGLDLQFPHHENEIAQSCCANGTDFMANYWLHNEMLQVEGKKMSKSLGNFFTVRDLLDQGVPGEVIRFVMLSTHYRKPMDWTVEKKVEAEATLFGFISTLEGFGEPAVHFASAGELDPSPDIISALSRDLDTHQAISVLKLVRDRNDAPQLARDLVFLGFYTWEELQLKVAERSELKKELSVIASKLEGVRTIAKDTKDFSELDRLKRELDLAGFSVRMSASEVTIEPQIDFDPSKLKAIK